MRRRKFWLPRITVAVLSLWGTATFALSDDDIPVSLRQFIGKSPSDFTVALGAVSKCEPSKPVEIELAGGDQIFGEAEPIEWENPLNKLPTLIKDSDLESAYRSGETYSDFQSKRIALAECEFLNGRRATAASFDGSIFYIRVNSLVCASQPRGVCRISESPADRTAFEYYKAYLRKNDEKFVAYNGGREFTNIPVNEVCENREFGCAIATFSAGNVVSVASFLFDRTLFVKSPRYKLSNVFYIDNARERDAHLALRKELSGAIAELTQQVDKTNSEKKHKQELLDIYR